MAADWIMTAVYYIDLVLVCVLTLIWIQRLVRGACAQKVKEVGVALRRALRWILRRSEAEEEDEEEDHIGLLVQKRMEAEVVKTMKMWANACAYFYVMVTVSVLLNVYQKTSRWMTPGQDVLLLLNTCLHSLLHLLPSLITPKTVRAVYLSQMLIGTLVSVFSATSDFGVGATVTIVFIMRAAASLVCLDQAAVPFANMLSSAVSCVAFVSIRTSARMLLIFEVLSCVLLIMLSRSLWRSRASTVRQEITATTLRGESRALTMLLNLMCDVVIELDQGLCIAEDSPKLSALLTLGGRRQSLKGSKLQAFMLAEEDTQRFEQCLQKPTGIEDVDDDQADFLPGAVPVKMRDSLGNTLNMELFYAQSNCLGRRRFFLGLRENSNEPLCNLKHFPREKKMRGSRRCPVLRSNAQRAQADAEASLGSAEVGSPSGSSHSDQELPGLDSEGRLMHPHWQPTSERGRVLVMLQAMHKCNIFVGPTLCCPWHASVDCMKATLTKFEGAGCARNFVAQGDWQCPNCQTLESARPNPEAGLGAGVEACSTCNYATALNQRVTSCAL